MSVYDPSPRATCHIYVFMCVRMRMRGRLTVIDLSCTRPALNTWTIATNTLTPSITAPLEAQRVHVCIHACAFECVSYCQSHAAAVQWQHNRLHI